MVGPDARPSRPRRSGVQRAVLTVGVLVPTCLLLAAAAAGWGYWELSHIDRVNVRLSSVAAGEPQNYLIVGSDSRAKGDPVDPSAKDRGATLGQRSDTIMVLRVDPQSGDAAMLSLPRDLWVPIAGRGGRSQRINTAYSRGKQTLVDTIEQDFGIRINHYLEIDFHGFQGLVSAMGGVPMWFDRAYRDRNSGLKVDHPGCVTLDGYSALAFARARHLEYLQNGTWHYDGTGDLGRISRQQAFIRRAINRAVSKGLGNPIRLKHLVEIGTRNISIDKGLSVNDLLALGRRFRKFNPATLKTLTVPASPFRTSSGAAVLRLDETGAQPFLNVFRGLALNELDESSVNVTVLNSSGRAGQAANVAGALQQAGFGIARWGNGAELGHPSEPSTFIRYAAKSQVASDLLARHLSIRARQVEDPSLAPGEVVLFVGQDFTTVQASARAPGSQPATTRNRGAAGSTTTTKETTTTTVPSTAAQHRIVVPVTTPVVGQVPGDPPSGEACG